MLREIKTFLTIQRCGTFAATAEELGMTQSAVSAQIKTLEQHLGFKLFDRSRRGATLNAAGERAIPYAEQIVELFDKMANSDAVHTLSGSLNLGAIHSVQTGLFPLLLPLLRERAPQLNISISQGVSYDLLGEVGTGRLDVAFIIRPPFELSQDFHVELVSREPYVLLTPASVVQGEVAEILSQQPFIRYNHASFGGREIEKYLNHQNIAVNEVLESDDLDAVVQFVKHGMGVALVPKSGLWTEHLTGLRLLDLGDAVFYRDIVAISRTNLHRTAELTLLKNCWEDGQNGIVATPMICTDIPVPEALTLATRGKVRHWHGATPAIWDYQQDYNTLR